MLVFKKTTLLKVESAILHLRGDLIIPAIENNLSTGALLAIEVLYFLKSIDNIAESLNTDKSVLKSLIYFSSSKRRTASQSSGLVEDDCSAF